jgi:hypothetical protein
MIINYCPNCGEPHPKDTCRVCGEDMLQYYAVEANKPEVTPNVSNNQSYAYEVTSRLPSGAFLVVVVDTQEAYDYLQVRLNAYP